MSQLAEARNRASEELTKMNAWEIVQPIHRNILVDICANMYILGQIKCLNDQINPAMKGGELHAQN